MTHSLATKVGPKTSTGLLRIVDSLAGFSKSEWCLRTRDLFHEVDLVVDLGTNIGSRDWWRGLATCSALCIITYHLGPDMSSIEAGTLPQIPASHWEESQTLTIMPLATGGDTGRRMAPGSRVEMLAEAPERPTLDLTATIGRGDGFGRSLQRAGVAAADAAAITQMVAQQVPPATIPAGTRVEMTLGRRTDPGRARPLDYMLFRARFDLKLAIERVNGQLRLRAIPIKVDNSPLRIQGRVGSSLYMSARAAGASASAVQSYIRAINQRVSIARDIYADDRFDLIVSHRRAETGEEEFGELLYAGLDRSGQRVQMVRWETPDGVQWFEASGVGERRGLLNRPVNGHQTSSYGMRRHPLLGYNRFHRGIDFGAPYGAPIMASADGIVQGAGRAGGYGLQVRLAHGGGIATSYSHMSRIAVYPGTRVRQGQVIGYIGSTGLSTGPHLHYELYRNGVPVDPNSVSYTTMAQLSGGDLGRFRARLAQLLAIRPGGSSVPATTTETIVAAGNSQQLHRVSASSLPTPSRAGIRPGA